MRISARPAIPAPPLSRHTRTHGSARLARSLERDTSRARRRREHRTLPGALEERAHHSLGRLVKHHPYGSLQNTTADLEIHPEVDLAAARIGGEPPYVVKVEEWAGLAHPYGLRPLQGTAASKALPERPKADCDIGYL